MPKAWNYYREKEKGIVLNAEGLPDWRGRYDRIVPPLRGLRMLLTQFYNNHNPSGLRTYFCTKCYRTAIFMKCPIQPSF